jgi:16S rRNA C967 or C1407 C5-methylase (RsmB/RsmF family)
MQVSKGEKIFDMCAAPGSKTGQFLETFYKDFDFLDPQSIEQDTGFVLANDNNWNRAYMMVHQLKRLNTAGMAVISHDAQFFPSIYPKDSNDRVLYDKILADVPCSSDAVLRKLPHKWRSWGTKDSYSLHKMQVQILKRGISMLKVGGIIIYSTCSLNPIENEAVVNEVMRNYNDSLEIVNMSQYFQSGSDIKSHEGLTSWKILVETKEDNKKFIEIVNKDDENYKIYKDTIDETCFPSDEETNRNVYKLQNCIRLFPHDSDTSGFFITMIRKTQPLQYGSDKNRNANKPVNQEKDIAFMNEFPDVEKWILGYYGLKSNFPSNQLVTQSKISKKISFISRGVRELLINDWRNQLKVINVGVKLFSGNKKKVEGPEDEHCKYRICQDGLVYILPFMEKRIFFCSLEFFIRMLKQKDIRHDDIKEDSDLYKRLHATKSGCVVLVAVKSKPGIIEDDFTQKESYLPFLKENYLDSMTCYNSAVRISPMISKEHQHTFSLKYNLEQ